MPKNKKGGNKSRKGKKNYTPQEKALAFKEEGMEYGQVVKRLGGLSIEVFCFDGETRLGKIRGKMRKRVWMDSGDIVLVSIREFEEQKCDILSKYTPDEAKRLYAYGEIPKDVVPTNEIDEESEVEIEFEIEI